MKEISSPVNLGFTCSVYNPDGWAAGGDLHPNIKSPSPVVDYYRVRARAFPPFPSFPIASSPPRTRLESTLRARFQLLVSRGAGRFGPVGDSGWGDGLEKPLLGRRVLYRYRSVFTYTLLYEAHRCREAVGRTGHSGRPWEASEGERSACR